MWLYVGKRKMRSVPLDYAGNEQCHRISFYADRDNRLFKLGDHLFVINLQSAERPSVEGLPVKRALIIRHVPYEGIAGYRAPIEAAGFAVSRVDVTDPAFSAVDLCAPDLLIMMGGPMGVYEADIYPWIPCQMRRLAGRLAANRPTLGVCFGAQMMAAALGADVCAGPVKEVGFHPVTILDNARETGLRHLVDVPVLHWHGDTFTLPDDVELLASSHVYDHQAFRRGPNILALQFHAEMGLDPRFDAWIEQWPESVIEAGGDEASLRAAHDNFGPGAVAAAQAMLTEWLAGLE